MTTYGIICTARVYQFEGWQFEFSRRNGPWPLKKNGDPRERAGRTFWAMWERFRALSKKKQHACMIERGGCVPFGIGKD